MKQLICFVAIGCFMMLYRDYLDASNDALFIAVVIFLVGAALADYE